MIKFVYSGLYFVQDENNFINPLLQVGAGSGPGGPKINGSDLIRIGTSSLSIRILIYLYRVAIKL